MDLRKSFIEGLLYPLMEKKRGNHVRAYLQDLLASEKTSAADQHKAQQERLKELLLTCIKNVPAYRGLLTEAEISADPFAALRKLPILTKADFRAAPDRYMNAAFDKAARIPNQTGGSTGEPLQFFMSRYAVEHYEAARWRGLSWWGVTPGSRSIMVWGNPADLTQNELRKHNLQEKYLKNRILVSAYALNQDQLAEYIRLFNRYQPEYFYGYATALYTLSTLLQPVKDQLHLKRLKVIVSTSETLHPEQRSVIEAVFGCKVVNEYGARDAGILAYQCPNGGMHISVENCIFEVVDPVTKAPVPDGGSGLVVITDLNNLAQPRLRYLLGDTATLAKARCACGRAMPLLKSVDGREDAMFKLPNGKLVHGHFLYDIMRTFPPISKYQLVQKDPAHGVLRLVCSDPASLDTSRLLATLGERLPGMELTLEYVPEIPRSASGKLRPAIREFAL